MDDFGDWLGRIQERGDIVDPARSNVLRAALGEAVESQARDALPALHHWLYFWEKRTPQETGADGHPKRGGFLPPITQARRMWAGGRLRFAAPLRLGEPVSRRSTILRIDRKQGRSGVLIFVTVGHEIFGPDGLAIEEEQDLVYRDLDKGGAPAPASPPYEPATPPAESVDPDPVLLFRYSALTMNSHRIHYDKDYAVGEENYPGLVVHGPLQATLLARLATRELGAPLSNFEFRGLAPAFAGRPLDLHATSGEAGIDLSAVQAGTRTMSASAS